MSGSFVPILFETLGKNAGLSDPTNVCPQVVHNQSFTQKCLKHETHNITTLARTKLDFLDAVSAVFMLFWHWIWLQRPRRGWLQPWWHVSKSKSWRCNATRNGCSHDHLLNIPSPKFCRFRVCTVDSLEPSMGMAGLISWNYWGHSQNIGCTKVIRLHLAPPPKGLLLTWRADGSLPKSLITMKTVDLRHPSSGLPDAATSFCRSHVAATRKHRHCSSTCPQDQMPWTDRKKAGCDFSIRSKIGC